MEKRNSSIELLRIIAMVFIVMHHFVAHGNFNFDHTEVTINRFFLQLFMLGGKIGVDVFVLISGYFLVKSSGVTVKKVGMFWLQLFSYSSIIYFVNYIFSGGQAGDVKLLARYLFPIIFENWWFASAYFVLYLLSPYLNQLIYALSKNQLRNLVLLLGFIWVVIPTFLPSEFQSNNVLFFIFLYFVAAYIRLYPETFKLSNKRYSLTAISLFIMTFMSAVIFDIIGLKFAVFSKFAIHFFGQNQLPIVLISICLLIVFLRIDLGHRTWINVIASATFGVYLLHDDDIVREFIWNEVFNGSQYIDSWYLIPYSFGVVAIVYVACTIVELIRQHTLEKLYSPVVSRYGNKIQSQLDKLLSK